MKIFEILQVSTDFWTNFLILSHSSGALPPEPRKSTYFKIFLNFSLNFREKFDQLLKNLQKIANFP